MRCEVPEVKVEVKVKVEICVNLRDLRERRRDEETELIILSTNSEVTIMNNLEIEIRMVKVIRKVLSILLIISSVTWFISHYTRLSAFDIVYSVFMTGAGIVFLLGKFGTEKILIRTDEASIFIKWVGRTRGKEILFTDIDRIGMSKAEVEIGRRGMKRVKFRLDGLDIKQKRQVYDFFIRLSGEKKLVLERHF